MDSLSRGRVFEQEGWYGSHPLITTPLFKDNPCGKTAYFSQGVRQMHHFIPLNKDLFLLPLPVEWSLLGEATTSYLCDGKVAGSLVHFYLVASLSQ